MKKITKNFLFNILITVTFILTFLIILTGQYFNSGFDLQVGLVSPQKFVANKTVENTYATDKLRQEIEGTVTPLYTKTDEVDITAINSIENFFNNIKGIETKPTDNQNSQVGTLNKISITNEDYAYLQSLSDDDFNYFKNNIISVVKTAYTQGVFENQEAKSILAIIEDLKQIYDDEKIITIASDIITPVLLPNLKIDTVATQEAKDEKTKDIEPIMVLKNQKVVDEGEIITEEIYSILNNLVLIKTNFFNQSISSVIGVFILLLILFSLLYYYIVNYTKIIKNRKMTLLFFSLFIFTLLISRLLVDLPYYFLPVIFYTMLVSFLIDNKLGMFSNIIIVFITFLIYNADYEYLIYFITTGTLTALFSNFTYERSKIIIVSFVISFVNALVIMAITLFASGNVSEQLFSNMIYAFCSTLLYYILSIGSLPIWESIFSITTSSTLVDLTNPNSKLLKRLTIEAPGTYHHSLLVSNLAEAAAYKIKADYTLARVGGLYHDIGKLKYPQYFSENIKFENPHNTMDPYTSYEIITNHVSLGIELAKKNKLPQNIIDIISQHHGNTLMKFFYKKAIDMYGEENVKKEDFRYKQEKPQTKEAAIIMLADTVEAAIKSMSPTGDDIEQIEEKVKSLIKDKLYDGQLDNCHLTLKDLDEIAMSFMDIFKGMYHNRVPYPTLNEEKKEDE